MPKHYDENNQQSILEYAKRLEGHTLRKLLSDEVINSMRVHESENKG